jgi:hypothetical protein
MGPGCPEYLPQKKKVRISWLDAQTKGWSLCASRESAVASEMKLYDKSGRKVDIMNARNSRSATVQCRIPLAQYCKHFPITSGPSDLACRHTLTARRCTQPQTRFLPPNILSIGCRLSVISSSLQLATPRPVFLPCMWVACLAHMHMWSWCICINLFVVLAALPTRDAFDLGSHHYY